MSKEGLADHEFAIIQEIAREPHQTQRELSRNAGLSLGMTNLLLVRLAKKGFIKVRQIDWKRSEYLLTLRGAMEKSRKSMAYIQHTFQLFQRILSKVQEPVRREYANGLRHFVIVAWPMSEEPISQAINELDLEGLTVEFVETFKALGKRKGTVFLATEETPPVPAPGQNFIHLLDIDDIRFRFPQ